MTNTLNHDWTADHRVAPILTRIAENGAPVYHYQAHSETSRGEVTQSQYTGADVDELADIYDGYSKAAWQDHEAWEAAETAKDAPNWKDPSAPYRAFLTLPTVEHLVRFVQGHWIDYRGNDRDAYFAKMDAVYPVQVAA
jgi:hypothetical protein